MLDTDHRPTTEQPKPESVATELAFRRSLRSSQGRRQQARRRRRHILRGRGATVLAAGALGVLAGGAVAAGPGGQAPHTSVSSSTVAAAQKALGVPADGIVGPVTRRAIRNFQRQHGLRADGVLGRRTQKALGVAPNAKSANTGAATSLGATAPSAALEKIAQCESAGNPTAISADGRYRGKYQFSLETWGAMGGSGDPAQAPEAEQDQRAAKLLSAQGPSAWPNCAS